MKTNNFRGELTDISAKKEAMTDEVNQTDISDETKTAIRWGRNKPVHTKLRGCIRYVTLTIIQLYYEQQNKRRIITSGKCLANCEVLFTLTSCFVFKTKHHIFGIF